MLLWVFEELRLGFLIVFSIWFPHSKLRKLTAKYNKYSLIQSVAAQEQPNSISYNCSQKYSCKYLDILYVTIYKDHNE